MSHERNTGAAAGASSESGFTLVEAMVAIVILIFGLMAVSNLFFVASSSTSVANQGTAAAVEASEVLEVLRATPWNLLVDGGGDGSADPIYGDDGGAATTCDLPLAGYHCDATLPGVGLVHVRWVISTPAGAVRTKYIQVLAEGTGAMSGARSRSFFTMFRTCTDAPVSVPGGVCPDPPVGGGL